MRLAREYERAEGRDLRGFLAYAAAQDLAEAREGEAALESEGLDAVRLMTIHRAKGLEFPVVCVADLGRAGRRPRGAAAARARRRAPACGSPTLGGGEPVPALGYDADRAPSAAEEEDAEERRLLYVAATRAEERLILSGGADPAKWPAAAARRPAAGLARAGAARRPAARPPAPARGAAGAGRSSPRGAGRRRPTARLVTAALAAAREPPRPTRGPRAPARLAGHGAARRAEGGPGAAPPAGPPQRRLSYSALQAYATLRLPLLPRARAGPAARHAARRAGRRRPGRRGRAARPAAARLARPRAARGARLRAARGAPRRGRARARGRGTASS